MLYKDGVRLFPETHQEVLDLMTEKEIRMRTAAEEVKLLLTSVATVSGQALLASNENLSPPATDHAHGPTSTSSQPLAMDVDADAVSQQPRDDVPTTQESAGQGS